MKKKEFKVKTKDNCIDCFLRKAGLFFKKPAEIVNLNDHDLETKCIMIGNHSGAGGPYTYRQSFSKKFMTWGAHQMCEGYRSRWKYLYYTFYQNKLHWGKIKSFIVATLFSVIAPIVYGYAGIIPIYYDNKIVSTLKYSLKCLDEDVSVFIFPEDSNDGYKEVIEKFYAGFLMVSKLYYKRYKVDLPIYTTYYSRKYRKIIIGKPMYFQEMLKTMDEEEILETFRNYLNSLYYDYFDSTKQ